MQRETINIVNAIMYIENRDESVLYALKKRGINSIIVYGVTMLSDRVLEACEKNSIEVKFVADRNAISCNDFQNRYRFLSYENMLELVDKNVPVIVTANFNLEQIRDQLVGDGFTEVYTIEDLIFDAMREMI